MGNMISQGNFSRKEVHIGDILPNVLEEIAFNYINYYHVKKINEIEMVVKKIEEML